MLALTLATTVHIGVFGSMHPKTLEVRPSRGSVLMVQAQGQTHVVQGSRAFYRITGPVEVYGKNGEPVRFRLSVPGRERREFVGRLEVRAQDHELIPIVEMDRETAVASILAGEGAGALAPEARKAQAIVTRSYLAAARGRHENFDFCDTTHCQRLHSPPPAKSPSSRAALETRGLVIAFHDTIVSALYHANCGGKTKTAADAGWAVSGYPYFAVSCPRRGRASGHGVGLCQLGAQEMARHGAKYTQIIAHYFPQTTVEQTQAPQLISGMGARAGR
jgi:peptidoglycan hydrolase-like amidase